MEPDPFLVLPADLDRTVGRAQLGSILLRDGTLIEFEARLAQREAGAVYEVRVRGGEAGVHRNWSPRQSAERMAEILKGI